MSILHLFRKSKFNIKMFYTYYGSFFYKPTRSLMLLSQHLPHPTHMSVDVLSFEFESPSLQSSQFGMSLLYYFKFVNFTMKLILMPVTRKLDGLNLELMVEATKKIRRCLRKMHKQCLIVLSQQNFSNTNLYSID